MAVAHQVRKAVPMKVQRDVALKQLAEAMQKLGMVSAAADVSFELDHDPALVLRDRDPETGEHVPHQHDQSCLIWRTKEAHERKTNGPGGEKRVTTAGGDKHTAAKLDRLGEDSAEFRAQMLRPKDRAPGNGHRGPTGFGAPQRRGRASAPLNKTCNPPFPR